MTSRKAPPTAWKPGQSGNPAGKKPGSRNKATVMVMKLMEDGAKDIAGAVVKAAKDGDMVAARIVIERLAPPLRERPVSIDLPSTETVEGVSNAQQAIIEAVACGDLLPGEGTTLTGIVENRRRALETLELEARIAKLEEKSNEKP